MNNLQTEAIANIQDILINGDLNSLSPDQRVCYVNEICNKLSLNPLTKPFAFIKFQGKMLLYATKDCAAQLRSRFKISLEITDKKTSDKLCIISVKASMPCGRTDEDMGVVRLTGDPNDILKAVTKAKRRVTLSIVGLGFLDETEVRDLPKDPPPVVRPPETYTQPLENGHAH